MGLPRVGLGLDPFLLRSAVHEGLKHDGRAEPWLLPPGADPCHPAAWAGCDVVVLSQHIDLPGRAVVVVAERGRWLRVNGPGIQRSIPYPGWDGLIDELLRAASAVRLAVAEGA